MDLKIKSKTVRWIVGTIVLVCVIGGVFLVDLGGKAVEELQPVRPLKMFTVGKVSQPAVRDYPGKVAAKNKAILAFQVSGQVVDFPTLKGQLVEKGQILAKLDDRDFRNRRNAAKAAYDQAEIYLQRIRKAVETGAVSRTDLTNAQSAYDQADANLNIADKDLEDTVLKAPYDAIISDTFIEEYETITRKEPILGIQDVHYIEVEASVPQERLLRDRESKGKFRHTVTFDPLPDTEFDVEVREYTTKADPKTQTYTVTFTMPVQDKYNILPGMTATLREYPIKEAFSGTGHVVVPIDRVPIDGQGQYYVWKIQKKGDVLVVHRQDVTIGETIGDDVEILNGLNSGDRIAAQGVHLLSEGQQVREYKLIENKQEKN